MATGGRHGVSVAPRDAVIAVALPHDAAIAVAPKPAADAAVAVAPKLDAAIAVDAGAAVAPKPPVVALHHAGRHHATPAVAPPPAQPTGSGLVDLIKVPADPYANVTVDGAFVGNTPKRNYKLVAGHHVIRFLDPASNAVIYTNAIDLADGHHSVVRN